MRANCISPPVLVTYPLLLHLVKGNLSWSPFVHKRFLCLHFLFSLTGNHLLQAMLALLTLLLLPVEIENNSVTIYSAPYHERLRGILLHLTTTVTLTCLGMFKYLAMMNVESQYGT